MATKPRSSRYGPNEEAEVHKARVKTGQTFATFQKQATLEKARALNTKMPLPPKPVELWADHMGVNPGSWISDFAIEKTLELGVRWVSVSPEQGWFTPEQIAARFKVIHDAGLLIHACAQHGGHDYVSTVLNPTPFALYCKMLCDLGADALTVGNEWNNAVFWKPQLPVGMAGPGKIHAVTIEAVRRDHPDLPVYSVGWSPGGGAMAPAVCQRDLCDRMMALQVNPAKFTGASHHPYCYNGPLSFGMPNNPAWNSFLQTPDVYNEAKRKGMVGPMSLTEYGVPSGGVQSEWPHQTFSEDHQASIINEYLQGFLAMRNLVPIAYMGLSTAVDGDASTRPIESTMGMFRTDGAAKPAAAVVKAFAKREW